MKRIDHLVVAVRDLDAAGDVCRRLGFQVGARNRHPWGTENRLVQFASSFIELISVGDGAEIAPHGPGVFSFGAFVRDYLARREGLAMLVLDSNDAHADAARFATAGIGAFAPFYFERRGRRPDGQETQVAFTLAFANPSPEAAFFVCQQHFPENFWNPAFQQHENGATNISAVTLAARRDFLAAFTGDPDCRLGAGGRLELVAEAEPAAFTGFTVGVRDIAAQAALMQAAGIPFADRGPRLALPAFGTTLTFEEI